MTNDLVIRRARLEDAEAMAAYMAELIAENLDTVSRRTPPTVEDEREWIEETGGHSLILLAFDNEKLVGLLDIKVSEKIHFAHSGLLGLSVAKNWRGRGIGRRMIQAAIELMRLRPGFCRIELECVAWNEEAKRLYESLGFVVEGRKAKSINLRGSPEDMYLMALTW